MIHSALVTSFKREILDGVHTPGDEYKMALFTADADLGPNTTTYYGQKGEVQRGAGYTSGGIKLDGRRTAIFGEGAYMTFSDPRWTAASFTAHGGLIYNASKHNRAVAVINFGRDYTCTNGNFDVKLPEPGEDAVIVID